MHTPNQLNYFFFNSQAFAETIASAVPRAIAPTAPARVAALQDPAPPRPRELVRAAPPVAVETIVLVEAAPVGREDCSARTMSWPSPLLVLLPQLVSS